MKNEIFQTFKNLFTSTTEKMKNTSYAEDALHYNDFIMRYRDMPYNKEYDYRTHNQAYLLESQDVSKIKYQNNQSLKYLQLYSHTPEEFINELNKNVAILPDHVALME